MNDSLHPQAGPGPAAVCQPLVIRAAKGNPK